MRYRLARIVHRANMSATRDKGKAKEIHPAVTSAIEDALNTPMSLSSSVDSSYEPSPIPRPPQAHQPPPLRPMRPRLLSQLTRSTMPTASLSYEAAGPPRRRVSSDRPMPGQGESSTAWMSASPVEAEESFPDLDPDTRMPMRSDSSPSLHLQRTITDLLASPASSSSSYLPFNIPKVGLPSLPNLPTLPTLPGLPGRSSLEGAGSRRNFSSTSTNDDWGSWATGWWSGHKTKVDATLSKEDQADTVEEEQEKHRRKCKLCERSAIVYRLMVDRTPKNPIVFCHGLLGFDYLGPASLPPWVNTSCLFTSSLIFAGYKSRIGEAYAKCSSRMAARSL